MNGFIDHLIALDLKSFLCNLSANCKARKLQIKVRIQRGQGQENEGMKEPVRWILHQLGGCPSPSALAHCLGRVRILQTPQRCAFVLILMCFAAQNRSCTVTLNIS